MKFQKGNFPEERCYYKIRYAEFLPLHTLHLDHNIGTVLCKHTHCQVWHLKQKYFNQFQSTSTLSQNLELHPSKRCISNVQSIEYKINMYFTFTNFFNKNSSSEQFSLLQMPFEIFKLKIFVTIATSFFSFLMDISSL